MTAAASGTYALGADLTVNRLGFGAMRVTGRGIWGPPPDRDTALAVLRRAVELDVTLVGPGLWNRNGRPEHLRAACEGSLRRLRVERIDVYQLHAPHPRVPFEESVGELARLRAEGNIATPASALSPDRDELRSSRRRPGTAAISGRPAAAPRARRAR